MAKGKKDTTAATATAPATSKNGKKAKGGAGVKAEAAAKRIAKLEAQLAEAREKEAAAKAKAEAKVKKAEPMPEPNSATIQTVALAAMGSDTGAVARAAVDPASLKENPEVVSLLPIKDETLAQVKDALAAEGQQYPVIIGTDDVIIDGHTRVRAIISLGWPEVAVHKVNVLGASPEGLELALSLNANKRHLSLTEKRTLMRKLLKAHPQWSNGRIGRLAGMSGEAVRLQRKEWEEKGEIEAGTARETESGRVVETGNIGSATSTGIKKFPAVLLKMPDVENMDFPEELTADNLEALSEWIDLLTSLVLESEGEEEGGEEE